MRTRLRTAGIKDALLKEYGDGEYVDPEGPLNIMRGHFCVNNDMIAKQRMFAAPMRLGYIYADDASKGSSTYTRNPCRDDVRKLPADSEAMVYLLERYKTLQSMFTVENDEVVVDRGRQAPFCYLFISARERCERLFAALLLLAGGADIRLDLGRGLAYDASLVAYDPVNFLHWELLDLEHGDRATLEAVMLFVKYGGVKASEVAEYGLHYTDSLSFLIQAYICEFVGNSDTVARIFRAAKEIVAGLPAGNAGAQLRQRFFTTDLDYVRTYSAGYDSLFSIEAAFDEARCVLLRDWQCLRHDNYGGGDDSKGIVSALLKLHYCLSLGSAADGSDAESPNDSQNELLRALGDFVNIALSAEPFLNSNGALPEVDQEIQNMFYADIQAVVRAQAPASRTIMDCCGGNIPAGMDPSNFLVVLAWVLGEPEEGLQSFQQLLNEALGNAGNAGNASHCQQIADRVALMLGRFSEKTIKAHFGVCTGLGGTRLGSLWLSYNWSDWVGIAHDYVLRLVFKPEKVKIAYINWSTCNLNVGVFLCCSGSKVPR
ncbi:hypothetical protein PAPHI01_2555 [Pancytospora philotis]|nr:hypothetical protein PAPHI01_2555 [Pancytospora philotis]